MKQIPMKYQKLASRTAKILLIALLVSYFPMSVQVAQAAALTSMSDVMSRLKAATASNHEIKFVTPAGGGVAAGETVTLLMTGFDATSVDAIAFGDVDFAEGNSNDCTSASFTEKTLAAAPSGATWGVTSDNANLITITSGTDTITADRCIRIKIGTNATSGTTGTNQITNGGAATAHSIGIAGSFNDTGTISIDIITDDQITISAQVDPTITFNLSTGNDWAIGFGDVVSTAGRWADADADGELAVSGNTPTAAHTATIATNASGGWAITYLGNTLTKSGGQTIDALAVAENDDSEGDPGTEQFGVAVSTSGNSTIEAGYERAANSDFKFIAGTATRIIGESVPTPEETLTFSYLANITGATEAGDYSTTLTYIATATF